MSTASGDHFEVAVIGAGVVGCAVALALAQRGAAVALLEAEPEPGLAASGTNSGILHTGFDSPPGELETELILLSAAIRDQVLSALSIPVMRCGALMRAEDASVAGRARRNAVDVIERPGGMLEIPGEAVTDPVAYTLALAAAAQRHGAELRTRWRVAGIEKSGGVLTLHAEDGGRLTCELAANCAGLHADSVARLAGDASFSIYPRKGEFLVFEPPDGEPLHQILLPVPTPRTKGVLVFPTLDGKVIAGPTAVDQEDKGDWSVRPEAAERIASKAAEMYGPLRDAEPIAAYAGLRPAGREANYIIGPSAACPRLVNVAAIRSTGLTASLGIGRRVVEMMTSVGLRLGREQELRPGPAPVVNGPWWRRTAEHRALA